MKKPCDIAENVKSVSRIFYQFARTIPNAILL